MKFNIPGTGPLWSMSSAERTLQADPCSSAYQERPGRAGRSIYAGMRPWNWSSHEGTARSVRFSHKTLQESEGVLPPTSAPYQVKATVYPHRHVSLLGLSDVVVAETRATARRRCTSL
jgi:hypothetical protein